MLSPVKNCPLSHYLSFCQECHKVIKLHLSMSLTLFLHIMAVHCALRFSKGKLTHYSLMGQWAEGYDCKVAQTQGLETFPRSGV